VKGFADVRWFAVVFVVGFVVVGSGCGVTLYQPMGVLQRPTAVHLDDPTFADTRILVRCLAGEDLPPGDADKVCRQVAQSLRQQGAETETVVPRRLDEGLPAEAFEGRGAELTVEIASRTEHSHDWPLLAAVSGLTLTAIPTVEEYTFVQDITVRARNHTVLTSDTLRARLVTYTGCLVWSANWLLDWAVRDDDNDVSGDLAHKAYSRDFYRQIAQLTHNARVRSDVLGLTVPRRRQTAPTATPAPTTTSTTTTTSASTTTTPPPATAPPPAPAPPAPAATTPPPAEPPPSSSSPPDLLEPPPLLSPPQAF
jgi:hypothetical protein